MKYFFLITFFVPLLICKGQLKRDSTFTLSAYIETYYCFDFAEPTDHLRLPLFYNYNRHNEINVNLALIQAKYKTDRIRANLGLMAGTYAQYNLASEPDMLQHIFEANVGIQLSQSKRLWLDAGILPSHIGFESAVGADCWNLTRSILADNSPYYETGARLSYKTQSEKIYCSLLYLNGWQRIKKVDGNQSPSFGSQFTLKPSKKFTFNWSTFVGNDKPDSLKTWRYFSNLYCQSQLSKRLQMILGFDIGLEKKKPTAPQLSSWYSPIMIARFSVTDKWAVAVRAEYYADRDRIIISPLETVPFDAAGFSMNIDFAPVSNFLIRIEGRTLQSSGEVFLVDGKRSSGNTFVSAALCLSF